MDKKALALIFIPIGMLIIAAVFFLVISDDKDDIESGNLSGYSDSDDKSVSETYSDLQQQARDAERMTDIYAIHGQLEAYGAKNGFYPTSAQLSDRQWVSKELPGLDSEALYDPIEALSYSYNALPASCDNDSVECESYTLSADLEKDGTSEKDEDSNTVDFSKNSLL